MRGGRLSGLGSVLAGLVLGLSLSLMLWIIGGVRLTDYTWGDASGSSRDAFTMLGPPESPERCKATEVRGLSYCPELAEILPLLLDNKRRLLRLSLDALTGTTLGCRRYEASQEHAYPRLRLKEALRRIRSGRCLLVMLLPMTGAEMVMRLTALRRVHVRAASPSAPCSCLNIFCRCLSLPSGMGRLSRASASMTSRPDRRVVLSLTLRAAVSHDHSPLMLTRHLIEDTADMMYSSAGDRPAWNHRHPNAQFTPS